MLSSRLSGLKTSSALNQVNNQDDDRNYEQEMDQTTANVAEQAKKPEHDQDNNYSPEHWYSFSLSKTFVSPSIQRFLYSPSFFRTSSRTLLQFTEMAADLKK